MPDTQDPPVKKNPFVLSPDELKAAAPKTLAPDQQPKKNPFVLDQADFQSVKKKDGGTSSGTVSSPTPSGSPSAEDINRANTNFNNRQLTIADADIIAGQDHQNSTGLVGTTPEQRKAYVDAHNGPKMSDLYSKTYSIINEGIPASTDAKINQQRDQLLSGVKSGDQGAITTAKNVVNSGIQKQINQILQQSGSISTHGIPDPNDDQKAQIEALKQKQEQITATLNDYAIHTAANSKETQTQVRAEVSGSQRGSTPNIAAEDLGKQVEKINGGLPNPNGNIQYARQKAGFETLIENKQMKINDLITSGVKTKNQTIIAQAKQEQADLDVLKTRNDNLVDQFPDVAVTQVSRMIGDEIAENSPRQGIITKGAVEESAKRIEAKHPGFLAKYGKFINVVEDKPGLVPAGDLVGLGGLRAGIYDIQYGSASFVAGLLGDTQTKEFAEKMKESPALKGTKPTHATPTNVIYDDKGKAFKEKPDNYYGKINWNSSTRFIGQSIPGLAEWVVAEEATGGVAGLAGAGKAAKATLGLVGASYVTSYDQNHKLAESLIEDSSTVGEAKKTALANLFTLTTAGAFKLVGYSPTKFVENAVTKAIAPDVLAALEENGWKRLPKNKLQDLMVSKIIPKVKTFAVETAKSIGEGAKVASAQLADTKVKEFVSKAVNPEKANATTLDENVKNFAQQALFMGLLGLPKSIVAGFDSPSTKDAFYEIGSRAPQYIDRINDGIKNGDYTQDQGNKMIATAKTLQEEIGKVQNETTKDGLPLTVGQKRDIAIQNFRKRAAKGLEESGVTISSEKVNNDADEQIKNTKSQNTHLPLEETEAFKTTTEVDEEGNEIGKPKSTEDIEDSKQYKYFKDGREVTTSGLELLSHLPQSEENIEDPLKDVNATARSLKRYASGDLDKMIDTLVTSGEITYTDEEGNPCAKEGLTTTSNPSFGGWEIVHDLKDKPSHNEGGVDLSIKGNTIEAEGRELVLKNKGGEMAIIPKKDRAKISHMISDNCEDCLNDYISKLPQNPDVAREGGRFDKEKSSDMGSILEGVGVEQPVKEDKKTEPIDDKKDKGTAPPVEDKGGKPSGIPKPDYADPKSREKYAEQFTKKYGPLMQGRGDTVLKVNEVPRGASGTAKQISTTIAKKYGLDPATLYSSSMEEGMSGLFKDLSGKDTKHRKPEEFGYQDNFGDKAYPINGGQSFGLNTFSDRFPDLVKAGYLTKDFENKFRGSKNAGQFNENSFKTTEDAMTAKAALIKYGQDDVEKYASKSGIKLSAKAKEFFSLVSYNGGEGTAHQMMTDYNKNGLLKDDKFIDERPTSGQGLKADSYKNVHENIKRRLQMSSALKSENLF